MDKKSYEKILQLNSIYSPLINYAQKCQALLKTKSINSRFVWANNHYEEYDGKYICETYPIPIIEIDEIGDIGFNLNECFYEGYFNKEKLISFNYEILKEVGYFSMYGESDYLTDIYNTNMICGDIIPLLKNSPEDHIAINFAFKPQEIDKIIEILIRFTIS